MTEFQPAPFPVKPPVSPSNPALLVATVALVVLVAAGCGRTATPTTIPTHTPTLTAASETPASSVPGIMPPSTPIPLPAVGVGSAPSRHRFLVPLAGTSFDPPRGGCCHCGRPGGPPGT